MEIQARFPYSQINHAQDTDGHLVLSLKAPAIDWVTQRPKLCLLPLIDLSGSMQGPKLEYAKRSLLKLVEHLTPGDICGLFAFESHFHPLVPPAPVTPEFKEKLRTAIGNLRIMGGTNLSDGLLGAIQAVKQLDLPLSFIQRVIVFTDGQPTEGVTDQKAILKMMTPALGNVTVSAFGYGDVGGGVYNGCDQDFLIELSQEAKGNYAYVKDPDAALGAFGKELGGLLSAYATDIRITVEPVNGHLVTKVISDVEAEEDVTGQVEVRLSNLLAEETRHIVMATKFSKQKQAFPRESTVFNVHLIYSVITAEGKKESKTEELKAKVTFVKPEDVPKEPDKEIDAIVGLAQMVRAQIEAEERAKSGDYKTAGLIMENMSQNLAGRGHQRLGSMSRGLRDRVSSNTMYAASTGYLRSVQSAGTRAYAVSAMDEQAAADLNSTGSVQLNNSVMTIMEASFTGSATPPIGRGTVTVHPGLSGVTSGAAVPPLTQVWQVGEAVLLGQAPISLSVSEAPPLTQQAWLVGSVGTVSVGNPRPVPPEEPKPKKRISQGKSKTRW